MSGLESSSVMVMLEVFLFFGEKEDADENEESCSSRERKVFVVKDSMVEKTHYTGLRI